MNQFQSMKTKFYLSIYISAVLVALLSFNEVRPAVHPKLLRCSKSAVASPGLDFSKWVPTDLSKYDPTIKVVMNLPKNAKIEAGLMGGLEIKVTEEYLLMIRSSLYESVADEKWLLAEREVYEMGKVLLEDTNGIVFTAQNRTLEGLPPYEAESHFVYFLGSGDNMYRIKTQRPFDNSDTPGSFYSEDNAKKFYDHVRNTAKIK
jgi:hypothetical protein